MDSRKELFIHGLRVCPDLDKLFFQYLAPNCGRIKVMRFVDQDLTIDDSPVLLFVQFYDRYTLNKQNIVSKPFDPIQYELDELIKYINNTLFLNKFRLLAVEETARSNSPFVETWPDTAVFLKYGKPAYSRQLPSLKLNELCPDVWQKQVEKEKKWEALAKLEIDTEIGRLGLGRTAVRLPQLPVQKADFEKQISPEKMDELVALFGKMAVANWSKMGGNKIVNNYGKACHTQVQSNQEQQQQ